MKTLRSVGVSFLRSIRRATVVACVPRSARGSTQPFFELYDLANDPMEMNNVYASEEYAGVRSDLKEQLLQLKEELGDTDEAYPELMAVRDALWNE